LSGLEELCLAYNDVGPVGAQYLGEALKRNSSLKSLKLSGCKIGLEGFIHIFGALQENKTLECLWMNDCDIDFSFEALGDVACSKLHVALSNNHSLRELHLRGNALGDKCILAISSALEKRTEFSGNLGVKLLDVGDCAFTTEAGRALLSSPTTLEYVCMIQNKLEDGLFQAANFSKLSSGILTPPSSPTSSGSCDTSQGLKKIDLGMNNITETGMRELCQRITEGVFPNLKVLEMGGNPFTGKSQSTMESKVEQVLQNADQQQQSWEDMQKAESEQQKWQSMTGTNQVHILF
jgi:Ran GTPase-activating protein (RanGAP) involved in mRNA processing and transport